MQEKINGTTACTYDKNGNLIQEIGPDERITVYTYDVENRLKAVMEGDRLLLAALYDGDGNRVFRMEYGDKTGGISINGADKEENSVSITEETKGEAGRSGSPLIPHVHETEETQEEITETRNNIFWYGFGQGLIQGLTTVPGYLSRWLHEHWEYILRRIDLHKDYEVHTFTEGGDEARKPKEGDAWTSMLYDEIFIPFHVGEEARENYVQTSYVNDVNRAYAETLAEYQVNGAGGTAGTEGSIYEYGLQRLSYMEMGSGELFTYLYDGRGSVSNLTSQSGASVLSYVYDAYGMAEVYNCTGSDSPASGIRNLYGYNGESTDPSTGFQYLRSRYYNSRTGSFLTEDTYSGSILEPLSQNRYTYTGNNPVNLRDPGGHAWIKGTAAKVFSAGKKAAAKPKAIKSSPAKAVMSAAKKTITNTKKTVSASSQKNKGTSRQNVSSGTKTAASKIMSAGVSVAKTSKSSGVKRVAAKTDWQQTIANDMSGTKSGTVRRVKTGQSYINNKLFTASSEKERKICAGGDRTTAGAIPTAIAVAPPAPVLPWFWGVIEGLLEGAAAALGWGALAILAVIGAGIFVNLGVGYQKEQTDTLIHVTPQFRDRMKEILDRRYGEQETTITSPNNSEIEDSDDEIQEGGGDKNNNDEDDGEEKELEPEAPEPKAPKPEGNSSSSENNQEGTNISKSVLKHILNRHMPLQVAKKFEHMSEEMIQKYLNAVSFFNKNWSVEMIQEALDYGLNEAINQGVEKGKYIFEYLGDIITIYIENGFLKTGYGNYKYTIDEIMFLLTGK